MPSIEPKPGDVVTLANGRWAVVEAEGRRLQLLRLNEAAPEPKRTEPKAGNVLDVRKAAEELGRSEKTIREYLKTGQLKGHKAGTEWRILRSDNPILTASI